MAGAPARRDHHGLPVRLGDDEARGRRRSTSSASPTRWRSCRPTARRTSCSTTPRRPSRGLEVIVAGAGGAAHLPGMSRRKTLPAGARRAGRDDTRCRGSTRCCRSCRCRPGCRSGRWRSARPGRERRAARGRDPGDQAPGVRERAEGVPREADARTCSTTPTRSVTAREGRHPRRRPARADDRPGRVPARRPVPRPRPGADPCAGQVCGHLRGEYDDYQGSHQLARRRTSSPTSSRTSRSSRPGVGAVPAARALERVPGPAHREGVLRVPRHPDRAVRAVGTRGCRRS